PVTAVRLAQSNRCWRTCLSAGHLAITTDSSILAARLPEASSSCRPHPSSKLSQHTNRASHQGRRAGFLTVGRTYSPPPQWHGELHERTKRLRRGTREDEGGGLDGRHLRSRDDGPRAQPDDPVHHGTGPASAPGFRRRPDGSPYLRAQLRHPRRVLARPSRRISSRP